MTDPKLIQNQGIGTGGTGGSHGGGGTHIYADLTALIESRSVQAQKIVLITKLSALAEYAGSIRDQYPVAYKAAAAAIAAGTAKLAQMFEVPAGK